jgi:DnaJ-domain-containing protein 1
VGHLRYIGRILGALGGATLLPNLVTVGLGFVCGLIFDLLAQKSRHRQAEGLIYQNLCLTYLGLAASFASMGRNPHLAWQALYPQLAGRPSDLAMAERYFHQCLQRPRTIDHLARELYAQVDGQPQQLSLMLGSLFNLAHQQGHSPTQQRILEQLSVFFRVDLPDEEPQPERLNAKSTHQQEDPPSPLKGDALGSRNPYQVLGIDSTATAAEIKSAYRKLVAKHHPDKLRGQGAGAKALQEAEEKMRVYNAAYDMLTKRQKE